MLTLRGAVQNYDWGSPTTIPEFLGVPADGRPWAEVWYGAHASHPAMALATRSSGASRPLDAVIAGDPGAWLGESTVERFGTSLPFLVKLLATRRALSIQVHPSLEGAREGFRREIEGGVPAASRNYSDGNHKPEAIVALTPLRALSGFRHAPEILADLDRLPGMDAARAALLEAPDEKGIARAFSVLQALPSDDADAALQALRTVAPTPSLRLARDLSEQFPRDTGALISIMLREVEVRPGQALSTGAGTVHAYLEGFGLEVMSSSDNVLRAGLTSKRVDVDEFARNACFRPGSAPVTSLAASWPAPGVSLQELAVTVPDFRLGVLEVREPGRADVGGDGRVTLLLALEGTLLVADASGRVAMAPGDAVLAAARDVVRVAGTGRVAVVTVAREAGQGIRVVPGSGS